VTLKYMRARRGEGGFVPSSRGLTEEEFSTYVKKRELHRLWGDSEGGGPLHNQLTWKKGPWGGTLRGSRVKPWPNAIAGTRRKALGNVVELHTLV